MLIPVPVSIMTYSVTLVPGFCRFTGPTFVSKIDRYQERSPNLTTAESERNSLVVCDESRQTKFPFSFVVLSWSQLWLICSEFPLILP